MQVIPLKKTGIFCYLLLVLSISLCDVKADTLVPITSEIRTSYGFVLKHHMDMGVYTTEHFPCFEWNLGIKTSGKKNWQTAYGIPVFGLGYWYSNLGNTSILGDVHALFFWERFPVVRSGKSSLNLRIGAGLGYFRKIFDRHENYKNLAIGSHVNAHLQLLIEYRYSVSRSFDLAGSLGMAHFSNGTMVTPNYGINIPSTGIAVSWKSRGYNKSVPVSAGDSSVRYSDFQFSISNGIKEIMPVLGKKYQVFAASADWIVHRSAKGGIGAGFDIFWDGSEKEILRRSKKIETDNISLIKPAIKAIKMWDMGKMQLSFELGVYLYEKEPSDGTIYDKVSMKYFITKNMFTALYLKTHYARADFIGWGAGFAIREQGKLKRGKVKDEGGRT